MMAGNPNWWSMNNGMHPQVSPSQFVYNSSSSNSSLPSNPSSADHHHHPNQDFPVRSWSQLLLGGVASTGEEEEEERFGASLFQQQKKLENWEDQVLLNLNPPHHHATTNFTRVLLNHPVDDHDDVKQEVSQSSSQIYAAAAHLNHADDQFHANWTHINHHQLMPVSSPTSCITNNNNILNFSAAEGRSIHQHHQDHSSEVRTWKKCNSSTVTGGVAKKARVQQSSAQPALKVRKEKLGDRITALHQLVSPFGKTDTASVLSEAIGYIRFLHGQIEALSSPYMQNGSGNTAHHQLSVQGRNYLFPEEPGQDSQVVKDLRSRGLCLVPIACTQNVGNDINGADYWGGGF